MVDHRNGNILISRKFKRLNKYFWDIFIIILIPRYQDKCLTRIQTALKNLPMDVKTKVENTLADSECLSFLNES